MKFLPMKYWIALCVAPALILGCAITECHADLHNIFPFNRLGAAMTESTLPRYTKLPLFHPHRKDFTCVYQAQHLPPINSQSELLFQQALALDDPNIYYKNRDWKKIYQLYQQSADMGNWKAMMNLAALILNYPVPERNPEVAIQWIEKAMKLGVPDAWDMMGIYHQNGIVKGGDATSAYAFFQKAADMGSPRAQVFLGEQLDAGWDNPREQFWANKPVAKKMLECAFAQGDGDAAYRLSFDYAKTFKPGGGTPEDKRRGLEVLQQGAKFGCIKCMNALSSEFRGLDLTTGRNLAEHIDKARAERYSKLGDALEFYGGTLKLPNLDKVLPLPPAPLPKWNGDVQTLINAAKAVTPPIKKPPQKPDQTGRRAIPEGYTVPPLTPQSPTQAGNELVTRTGYWLALDKNVSPADTSLSPGYRPQPVRGGLPEYYQVGEHFEPPTETWLNAAQTRWHYLGEAQRVVQPLDIATHEITWTWLGSPNRVQVANVYEIAV